jgi:hypothetical protein
MQRWQQSEIGDTAVVERSILRSMARRRRRVASALLVAMALNAAACYVDKPLATTPAPGQQVSLMVSDQGRVALGPQLGAGVNVVEGRLTAVEGDTYLVNVSRVRPISGPVTNWSGEQVRIDRSHIAVFQERKLSRTRSLLVAGIVVAGVGVFAATRSLLGLGEDDPIPNPPDPGPDQ